MDFNARIELDSTDFNEVAIDALMEVVDPYHGSVARAVHGGRVELILTLPAENLRQATVTALSVVLATGHRVYAFEVLPTDEFHRRIDAVDVPPLMSVPQAAGALGVTRQRALQLVNAGQLDAVKVGDTWAIPAAAVATREGQTGLRWSGTLLLTDVVFDGKILEGDGVDVGQLPLPVFDERERLIGMARAVRREQGNEWSAAGLVSGLQPGEYRIAPRVHAVEQVHTGDCLRIYRSLVHGMTVLATAGRGSSFGAETQIVVSEGRGWMDFSEIRGRQEPVEVFTYS
jgi:excisionase family DNA binding protein